MSERTIKLEELIHKYEDLKKDLTPVEEELDRELTAVRLQVLDRARARTSFTGDRLKDLCIFKFGREFEKNYRQLLRLRDLLKSREGEFILIHDTAYNLLINELDETDRCYIPFRVAALGMIDSNPLETGYEYEIAGDKYYLKLRFKNGAYIRELEVREPGKLDKWISVLPVFRGRGEDYTEKTEQVTLVKPLEDYESSEEYIRHLYTDVYTESDRDVKPKPKKPYWRIAPDKFDTSKVRIGSMPAVEVFETLGFPAKEHKVFAFYIGNEEVRGRLHLDVQKRDNLESIYEMLNTSQGKTGGNSLIF
jgi:hypothetical protein